MPHEVSGIGLQLNPTMLVDIGLERLAPLKYDFAELLCDSFAGPLDSGYVIEPSVRPLLEEIRAAMPTVAHGNYGAEFGFEPLEATPAIKRHVALTEAMNSPWYADHMFFGDVASSYMWSSPLQFSKAEVERVAGRAAKMQDYLRRPLLHENAFYYARFPGSVLAEAEFIAEIIRRAQTYSLLDLHNVYANSVNFVDYDSWVFLRTIPLDRVLEIHLAGGQYFENWYHDFHNHLVPEPVWEMLEYVLPRAPNLKALCLEVQGPAHHVSSRRVGSDWSEMIGLDLGRMRALWDKHKSC
jgi:uncharacterized protein